MNILRSLQLAQRANETCANCSVQRDTGLLMCPCRLVHYCSTACQIQHWKTVHQNDCTHAVRGSADQKPPMRQCYSCQRSSYHLHSCHCEGAYYCDRECQRKHWGQHRKSCSIMDLEDEAGLHPLSKEMIVRLRRKDGTTQTEAQTTLEASTILLQHLQQHSSQNPLSSVDSKALLQQGSRTGIRGVTFRVVDELQQSAIVHVGTGHEHAPSRLYPSMDDAYGPGAQSICTPHAPPEHHGGSSSDVLGFSGRPLKMTTTPSDVSLRGSASMGRGNRSMPITTPSQNPLLPHLQHSDLSTMQSSVFPAGASPMAMGSKKGTVMANVLSGAAAHYSRSRSGVFFGSGGASVRSMVIDPHQREFELQIEELCLDEEEGRQDIGMTRREQYNQMRAMLERLRFIDAAKRLGQVEEAERLDVVTQYNLWFVGHAVPAFRRR